MADAESGLRARVASLHHVTAIADDTQQNYDFYTGALGLRFVKKTVNFDAPDTYHLYYGDRLGSPGTALTFFPYPGAPRGFAGLGQSVLTQFSVPPGSLPFWAERLQAHGAAPSPVETVFAEHRIVAKDPDGAAFALVEVADDPRADGDTLWTTPEIGAEHAIRGFHGVTLALARSKATEEILTKGFAFRRAEEIAFNADHSRLIRFRGEGPASVVDILEAPEKARGREGAGSVHHVAFRVADRHAQEQVQERLEALGYTTTPQIDRDYFWSIYFRTPGGVLFEVATDAPGFTVDEAEADLGSSLKLPEQHEPARSRIEERLPPLETGKQ